MYPSALGVIPDPLALTPVLFFQVTPILDDINLFKFLIKKKKKMDLHKQTMWDTVYRTDLLQTQDR